MCLQQWFSAVAEYWNCLGRVKTTNAWVLFPRDPGFIDMRCSLGVGSLESFRGNSNVQSEPLLCRVRSVVFLCHSRHQVDGTSRLAELFYHNASWLEQFSESSVKFSPLTIKKICVSLRAFGGRWYKVVFIPKLDKC